MEVKKDQMLWLQYAGNLFQAVGLCSRMKKFVAKNG